MSLTGLNISKLDKSKTKFKAIEINKVYKGSTVESNKTSGSTRQHGGLQVLGKVGPTRRMPPPVHLPSLKSEHGFSDPVNLVPTGGSGWGGNSKEEDKAGNGSPASSVLASSNASVTSKSSVKESTNGPSSSTGQLWSSITSGKQGLMNKKQFQEDFPELAANPEDKVQSSPKKEEKPDPRLTLGPSLKPQNMLSWREGGGRKQVVEDDEDDEKKEAFDHSKLRPTSSPEDDDMDGRRRLQRSDFGYPPMPPYMSSQGGNVSARLMKPPVMGPMMGRMPGSSGGHPPSHMMYGPMVPPQFMFHPRPGYGPPPPFPGYLPPPPRHHMPYPRSEQGFHHGVPPHMRMPPANGGEAGAREVIVKDQSLKDFDKISLWEGGWASKVTEVDYSKKLEFSDDEDNTSQKPSSDVKVHQSPSPVKEASNFKTSKACYDEDLFTFNTKAQVGERSKQVRDYEDDDERVGDDYQPVGDWSDKFSRRKAPDGFKNDDVVYKPPSLSRSEDYYYGNVYGDEERYETSQMRAQNKPTQPWIKFAKKDREFQDSPEPVKPSKSSIKEYQAADDRRYNSTDSERDEFKREDKHDAKSCAGSSDRNSESPDQYKYPGDKKDYQTEERASRHHDNASEQNRLSGLTSYSKSPSASDKFEKSIKTPPVMIEEKSEKIIVASAGSKDKASSFDKPSNATRHVCPPPITSKYARQDPPAPSKYISLKKVNKVASSDANSFQMSNTPGRNVKNLQKDYDSEENLQIASQSTDNGSTCGGRKNWADSIDEEEQLELKKNVWENTSGKKNRLSQLATSEEELTKPLQNVASNKTGLQSADSGKQQKSTSVDDKSRISKDVKAGSENYKEYSSKYSDRQKYEDKHSVRKQSTEEHHSGHDDGFTRRSTTRGGSYGGSDVGYQEFTRSGAYNRSSHSQQFRRSNYHVLTSRKTNVSETNIMEKDKSDLESKQKSEHSSRSDVNPWRITKAADNARDEKRDSTNHQRSSEAVFEDKPVVEPAKADEGAGDGVCKEVEVNKTSESLKEIILPPVQHKVLTSENVWTSTDYKESFEDGENRHEADSKDNVVVIASAVFKADQNKEKVYFNNQSKQKSESDHSSLEAPAAKASPVVHQPPPNVWLNRQKQEPRKVEERPQLVKNVWKSKNDNLQKNNFSTNLVNSEINNSNKEASSQSQTSTSSSNPAPKKPPALMDMLIAKPPTALLKESQLLSNDDILDSDWNSSDNLSYPGRRSERRGYSRTVRGWGNQRRRTGGDQPDNDGVKDDERDNKSRNGHSYRYGDSNRRNRGLTRGYKGRSEYGDETDHQDASGLSDDRRKSKFCSSRSESKNVTGDRKSTPGSLRGRRRGNKTSISSGTGVTSNCATNESDIGNEEWETASESSDVLQNTHSQRISKSHKVDDDRLHKTDRMNKQFTESYHDNKEEAAVDDPYGKSKKTDGSYYGKNGRIQPRYQPKRELIRKNSFSGSGKTKSNLEQTADKVTSVTQKNLTGTSNGTEKSRIESATTGNLNKFKQQKVENTEPAKPKYEREKKDILATIDVNNYASVVVVDNHPEVSIDDPSFLFEKNEGFQEVTSRRTLKSKMKAAQQEEAMKKAAEQQRAQAATAQAKKIEKDLAKSRPVGATSTGDNKLQRNPKPLQARLIRPKDSKRVGGPLTTGSSARKFSISEDDRNAVLPKIENWNNDMAKSIPPLVPSLSHSQTSSSSTSTPASIPSLFSSNTEPTSVIGTFGVVAASHHACAQDGGMNAQTYQSMYAFPVESWEKEAKQDGISNASVSMTPGGPSHIFSSMSMPISEWSEALLGSKQPVIAVLAGDQGGLLNMPSMEKRDHDVQHQNLREGSVEKMSLASSPKPTPCHELQINESDAPSCEVKTNSLGVSITGDEGRAVKKPEGSSSARSQQNNRSFESLDIHSGIFKYKQGEDSSDIKLDFAFDANLQTKIPEPEKKTPDAGLSASTNLSTIAAGANNNSSGIGCSVTSSSHLPHVEMMSASDEDLGYKLAQVKNVWDRESAINYEQGLVPRNPSKHAAPTSSSISMDINDQIRQQQASSYLNGMSVSVNDRIVSVVPSQVDVMDSSSVVPSNSLQQPMTYADAEMTFKDTSVDTYLSEQPNVCKVKPQLQASLATPSLNQFSGVASPPTPAQQHLMITFGQGSYAFGSQLLTPDCGIGLPFGQHAYLAAPATQTPLLAPLAIASQPSLFLGHTPNVQSDIYGAQYRNLFGLTQQPQQQQSNIMVSSATSTLMSTAIKNQQYSEYFSSGSKQANTLSAFPYGQILGNSPIMPQPSQIGLPYDTAQYSALQPDPTIMPPSNSQIVGSHLMPQRNAALHGLSSSAYYPQTLLQQSCFQQQRSGSHLQGSFQQYQLSAAFNMQPVALSVATGNCTPLATATGLNFQAQQPLANQSQLKHSAPPFKPSSQRLALSPNGQKFSASGMINGNNLNKNSLLSFHLQQQQQQQDQQNASMLSSSFLLQQNLPNNIGSGLSNHNISLPSQYQLFTQQQQLQQLQQTIQLHQQQQQQQHSAPSGFLTQQQVQQQQQPSNYSTKDRYGMTSMMNQQGKYPQSLPGPSQMQQKYEQFGGDSSNAMDSQQPPSNNLLQNQFQSCKTQHGDMSTSSVSSGSGGVASSKPSPSSASTSASLALPPATNVMSQISMHSSCEAASNVSSALASSPSSPTSFKSSGSSAPPFQSSSAGNKWSGGAAGGGFAGNLNFQNNQQYQHQSFIPQSDRFNYGYHYSGPKSDASRDNSQSSRTSLGSKSVTIRNAGNKGDATGGFGGGGTSFHSNLLRTGGVPGNGNVGIASRAERPGSGNFYSLNAKDIKDLQAEERKKAMMDIQSFLNPENKPPQKLLQNPPNSSSPTYMVLTPAAKQMHQSENMTGDQEVMMKTGEN